MYLKQQADNLTEQLSLFRRDIELKEEELQQRKVESELEVHRRNPNLVIGNSSMVINHVKGNWELQFAFDIINKGQIATNVDLEFSEEIKNKIPAIQKIPNQESVTMQFQIVCSKYGTAYKEPTSEQVLKTAGIVIIDASYDNTDNDRISSKWELTAEPQPGDKRRFNTKIKKVQ